MVWTVKAIADSEVAGRDNLSMRDIEQVMAWTCNEARILRQKREGTARRMTCQHLAKSKSSISTEDDTACGECVERSPSRTSNMTRRQLKAYAKILHWMTMGKDDFVEPHEFQDPAETDKSLGSRFSVEEFQESLMRLRTQCETMRVRQTSQVPSGVFRDSTTSTDHNTNPKRVSFMSLNENANPEPSQRSLMSGESEMRMQAKVSFGDAPTQPLVFERPSREEPCPAPSFQHVQVAPPGENEMTLLTMEGEESSQYSA
jgi:hypothetical protein